MKIKKIFSLLLFISSLASAMEVTGSKAGSNGEMRKAQQLQQEVRARSETQRKEEESQGFVDLERGDQVRAVDPTMASATENDTVDSNASVQDEDEFEQMKHQIEESLRGYKKDREEKILSGYKKRNEIDWSIVYAHHALEALYEASWRANYVQADSNQEKMIGLHHEMAAVYKSMACDYMDAAEAENRGNTSKPYTDALQVQKRILACLDELKKQMGKNPLTPASEQTKREEIQQLREVTIQVRTINLIGKKDPNYAGERYFSEMPH